jgi:hypothetical protein
VFNTIFGFDIFLDNVLYVLSSLAKTFDDDRRSLWWKTQTNSLIGWG